MDDRFARVKSALLLLTAAVGLGFGVYHRPPPSELGETNAATSAAALTNAPIQRISEGVYALGLVQLDKQKRTIRVPAVVNMADGLVEYALVHVTGKVHESVLKTEAIPYHIHLANLLLSGPPEKSTDPKTPMDLVGAKIRVDVEWQTQGAVHRVSLEDLVLNKLTAKPMTRGDWIYNGSRVVGGTFLAQNDGSIVAIIADPDAMVNNPRPGRDDDEIWTVNQKLIPPVGTPVQLIIQVGSERTQ